jgi:hypothetical protein
LARLRKRERKSLVALSALLRALHLVNMMVHEAREKIASSARTI